jgi:hypothetical protein
MLGSRGAAINKARWEVQNNCNDKLSTTVTLSSLEFVSTPAHRSGPLSPERPVNYLLSWSVSAQQHVPIPPDSCVEAKLSISPFHNYRHPSFRSVHGQKCAQQHSQQPFSIETLHSLNHSIESPAMICIVLRGTAVSWCSRVARRHSAPPPYSTSSTAHYNSGPSLSMWMPQTVQIRPSCTMCLWSPEMLSLQVSDTRKP